MRSRCAQGRGPAERDFRSRPPESTHQSNLLRSRSPRLGEEARVGARRRRRQKRPARALSLRHLKARKGWPCAQRLALHRRARRAFGRTPFSNASARGATLAVRPVQRIVGRRTCARHRLSDLRLRRNRIVTMRSSEQGAATRADVRSPHALEDCEGLRCQARCGDIRIEQSDDARHGVNANNHHRVTDRWIVEVDEHRTLIPHTRGEVAHARLKLICPVMPHSPAVAQSLDANSQVPIIGSGKRSMSGCQRLQVCR